MWWEKTCIWKTSVQRSIFAYICCELNTEKWVHCHEKKIVNEMHLKENFPLDVISPVQTWCFINFAWPWLFLLCGAARGKKSGNYLEGGIFVSQVAFLHTLNPSNPFTPLIICVSTTFHVITNIFLSFIHKHRQSPNLFDSSSKNLSTAFFSLFLL